MWTKPLVRSQVERSQQIRNPEIDFDQASEFKEVFFGNGSREYQCHGDHDSNRAPRTGTNQSDC
ncbi:MAG: hypothetical protein R3B47_19065 [Bacteroidia bacterium]